MYKVNAAKPSCRSAAVSPITVHGRFISSACTCTSSEARSIFSKSTAGCSRAVIRHQEGHRKILLFGKPIDLAIPGCWRLSHLDQDVIEHELLPDELMRNGRGRLPSVENCAYNSGWSRLIFYLTRIRLRHFLGQLHTILARSSSISPPQSTTPHPRVTRKQIDEDSTT